MPSEVSPTVSVILCTWNRCESLQRTLETFCALEIPADWNWELLVVDNNSTDATRSVCESFASRLPVRHLFEARQGKSHALRRGIEAAGSGLLVFTDDDVDVDPRWLRELHDAAGRHPGATFFGGKILPRWETPPPRWLEQHSGGLLAGVTVHYDRGDVERALGAEEVPFFGANLALRRRVFADGFEFRTDIGPSGAEPTREEETELQKRLRAAGHHGVYSPAAVVHHRNPPHRMTERYVREWFKGAGICEARLKHYDGMRWFGVPPRVWQRLVSNAVKYSLTRWHAPSRVWVRAERKMAKAWGMIIEYRRQRRARAAAATAAPADR
jgi:glycosyltransferase involved in cell wall biosynthesis